MITWVFPGQGSQFLGMGAGLEKDVARRTFSEAADVLGWDVAEVCRRGPAGHLDSTEITQPAIFTVSVAAARTLEELRLRPDAVAGHSVGEFAAAVTAGALGFQDALRAVSVRAHAMHRAARDRPGSMAAVIGLGPEQVEALCASVSGVVRPANYNGPAQTVISGEDHAVLEVAARARAEGGRVIRLKVSVAAHSPLMVPAQAELASCLGDIAWSPLRLPIASGVTGRTIDGSDELVELLVRGVTEPVRWMDCVRTLCAAGTDLFVEVGPGQVLTGLIGRIAGGARTAQVGDDATAVALAQELAAV